MLRVTNVLPALLMLVPLTGLTAQASNGLLRLEGENVRVRVAIGNGGAWSPIRIQGRVVALHGDSIQIVESGGRFWSVPVADVQSLDVKRGRDRLAGAVFGILGGAAFGTLMSLVPPDCNDQGSGSDCGYDGSRPSNSQYWSDNIGFGVFQGVIMGAAIGVERWDRIMAAPSISVRPVARGLGLRLTF